jgi:phage terminase large subunit GpA-like protein
MKKADAEIAVMRMHVVCRDCGEAFTIEASELRWLRERKLEPFSRCRECRRKRREAQARQAAAAPPGEKKRPW